MKIAAEESSKVNGKDYRFIRIERDNPDDLFERMVLIVSSDTAVNVNRDDNKIILTLDKTVKK